MVGQCGRPSDAISRTADTIMEPCCRHSDDEHSVVNICHEVIHYPSEDYPCICPGFDPDDAVETCVECNHSAAKHPTERICRPSSGDFCACRVAL
jgi:hypothetical protein